MGGPGEFHVGPRPRAGLIETQTRGPLAVQYIEVDGVAILEGDIELSLIHTEELAVGPVIDVTPEGVIITGQQFRWPDGVVPYDIDPELPNQERVSDAISHWERNTRIRFVRRTDANAAQYPDYVFFQPSDRCSSSVGRRQAGRQGLNLAPECGTGSTIHEIGHAVGLWHEQSREDRDNFVTIHWENIEQEHAHNFNQHITDGDDVGPYDYHSIMHYPRRAFSDNGDTITPRVDVEIGQRQGLSPGDCSAVRFMYSQREPTAVFRGVQFRGTVPGSSTRRWFTHSWPAHWYVVWTVVPTAPAVDGPAQVEWKVQVARQSGGLLKYFVEIRNLTAGSVDIEARYDVLGWSSAAT